MSRRPSSDELAQATAAKVEATQRRLEAEIAKLVSGEDWRRYLDFQSRLHRYSAGNTQLIGAAHAQAYSEGLVPSPEPSFVAGYRTWAMLGRNVQRGQRGYPILAPVRVTVVEAVDAGGNRRRLGRGERAVPGETVVPTQAVRGWRIEHVWDVSQTSGEPLPEIPRPRLLEGQAPAGLRDAVLDLARSRGFTVGTVPDAAAIDGANGCTDWVERTVVVRADMDDAAQTKTLLHEAAHVLLHARAPGWFLPRPVKEVEAESVAYVVASAHGMRTDEYSFSYIAAWAGAEGPRAVAATQARVAEAAKTIIAASRADHFTGGQPPGLDLVLSSRTRHVEQLGPPARSALPAATL
jgi:hypothetical protein